MLATSGGAPEAAPSTPVISAPLDPEAQAQVPHLPLMDTMESRHLLRSIRRILQDTGKIQRQSQERKSVTKTCKAGSNVIEIIDGLVICKTQTLLILLVTKANENIAKRDSYFDKKDQEWQSEAQSGRRAKAPGAVI